MDNMNYLEKTHIDKIQKVYHDYVEMDRFSKVITNQEIIDNNCLLSIQTYIDTLATDEPTLTIEESLQQWQSHSISTNSIVQTLSNLL
jgi:type I restriction-modification system DNA methylase subunit